jgi:DNA-binding MurR/RpiR family transcriptional regulator
VLGADIENINDTVEHLDPQAFELAVESILAAKRVYIIGIRSCKPLAEFLQFYLNMVRDNIILLDSTSTTEIFEQMLRINENDVVIGISFPRYSMRTLKAMEMANDKNAKVISITDSIHSPMCLYSSCNLFARSDMVSIVDSLVAPLSLINALVVAICLKRPDDVKESLESLEYAWDNYQVYLKDEINFIDEDMLNTPLQEQMGQRSKV